MQADTPSQIDSLLADADLPNPSDWDIVALLERYLSWPVVAGFAIRIAIILAVAFLSYRLVKILTARLQREREETDPLVKRLREQRAQTVASLLNNVALVVIVGLTILMILTTLGVNIGPLLATAGVVGLAISFGAQSLVKDIISGAFILMEGQFGIGDVVRVGEISGQVERITLRTTIMRDVHGVVHVVPNGEITTVSNLTKSWSRALLEIGVAYKEDVDHVMAVLRELGQQLYDDPDWRPLILEPPEVPGVQDFADSAVIIRVMVKTVPLKQWDVARELRRRIKKRFDADGIEIPFPHRTVYWGEGQHPGQSPDHGALAARVTVEESEGRLPGRPSGTRHQVSGRGEGTDQGPEGEG